MNFSKKLKESFLQLNSFAVYGLGATGRSVVNFLNKNKVSSFFIWDDDKGVRNAYGINKKYNEKYFSKILDETDWIILSPGINIEKSKFKKSFM